MKGDTRFWRLWKCLHVVLLSLGGAATCRQNQLQVQAARRLRGKCTKHLTQCTARDASSKTVRRLRSSVSTPRLQENRVCTQLDKSLSRFVILARRPEYETARLSKLRWKFKCALKNNQQPEASVSSSRSLSLLRAPG